MMIQEVTAGRTRITIVVGGFAPDRPVSDDFIAGFAMAKVNESPERLFDWTVHNNGGDTVTVTLHTD